MKLRNANLTPATYIFTFHIEKYPKVLTMFCDDREARKHKSHTLLIGKYGIKWEILCGGKFGNTYTLTTSFAPRTPFLGMYPTNPLTHTHKDKWARYSVLQRLEELKIKTKPNVYQ